MGTLARTVAFSPAVAAAGSQRLSMPCILGSSTNICVFTLEPHDLTELSLRLRLTTPQLDRSLSQSEKARHDKVMIELAGHMVLATLLPSKLRRATHLRTFLVEATLEILLRDLIDLSHGAGAQAPEGEKLRGREAPPALPAILCRLPGIIFERPT